MKYTPEQIKIMKDFMDQKNENKRMERDVRWEWRIRGYLSKVHYWIIAYNFPIGILIWFVTDDFWKGLAFLAYTQIYCVSANLRGLGLHIENLVEWNMTNEKS